MKYSIQYGIIPYFRKLLHDDLRNAVFSFKIDETTTEKVQNQYDGYVQYSFSRHQQIRSTYLEHSLLIIALRSGCLNIF